VEGAATALVADRARAKPKTTHETFNHDVIGYTPVCTKEPSRSLTQTVHSGTTKVPEDVEKIARYRLLVPHCDILEVIVTETSRYVTFVGVIQLSQNLPICGAWVSPRAYLQSG
jgi:hypothetical protein